MKLEDQVCSLELAKSLKSLGVKQESLFWWIKWNEHYGMHVEYRPNFVAKDMGKYSTFTVAELGEMLPANEIHYSIDGNQWCVLYGNDLMDGHGEFADTEADARAKMLIYLIENKLINPQEK